MVTALKWLVGRLLRLIPENLLGRILPGPLHFDAARIPAPPKAPDAPVRLYVGPVNWAGQGWQWAHAAESNLPGVGAINMAYHGRDAFGFASDDPVPVGAYVASRRWQRAQFAAVRDGFSHVLVEAERQPFGAVLDESVQSQIERLLGSGIEVAFVCHGSDIRLPSAHADANPDSPFRAGLLPRTRALEREVRRNRALLDRMGLPVFVSTPDLLLDVPGATWLPVVIDNAVWRSAAAPLQQDIPIVVHAPSSGPMKGSDLVDPVMRRLDSEGLISYQRVEGIPAADVPALYRHADVVLDQFRLGDYGVAACEAMAAGRVVVAHVSEHSREYVRARTGLHLPIVEARAVDLEAVIRTILADRPKFRRIALEGAEFAAAVHSGARSAAALAPFLTGVTS